MKEKHSRMTKDSRAVWFTERLWALSRDLPRKLVAVSSIREFDQNCWFGSNDVPTCREIAKHAQRIFAADDALQLASALRVAQRLTPNQPKPGDASARIEFAFVCAGEDLNMAAKAEGLSTIDPK